MSALSNSYCSSKYFFCAVPTEIGWQCSNFCASSHWNIDLLERVESRISFNADLHLSGADPGFPVGLGANPRGGAPTYEFAKFCKKLHEIEKILGRRGRAPLFVIVLWIKIEVTYFCINLTFKFKQYKKCQLCRLCVFQKNSIVCLRLRLSSWGSAQLWHVAMLNIKALKL